MAYNPLQQSRKEGDVKDLRRELDRIQNELRKMLKKVESVKYDFSINVDKSQIAYAAGQNALEGVDSLTYDKDSDTLDTPTINTTDKVEFDSSSAAVSESNGGAFRANNGKLQWSQDSSAWIDLDSFDASLTDSYIGYGDNNDELTGDQFFVYKSGDNNVRIGPSGINSLLTSRDGDRTGYQLSIIGPNGENIKEQGRLVFAREGSDAGIAEIGEIAGLAEFSSSGSYDECCRITFRRDTTYSTPGGKIELRVRGDLGSGMNAPLIVDGGHNVKMVNTNVASNSNRGFVSIGNMTGHPSSAPDPGNGSMILASDNRLMTYSTDDSWMHPNERLYTQREVFTGDTSASRTVTIYDFQGAAGANLGFSITHESGLRGSDGKMWYIFNRGTGNIIVSGEQGAVIGGTTTVGAGKAAIVVDVDDDAATDYFCHTF